MRVNKNSTNTARNKHNSKETSSSPNEDYYRRINIQPSVVETPMSPRTAKWVRELTPVLEPYNFDMNEISDLIHRCHYDPNQIELAVGNVIEDFSGHESGQWTKVGKHKSGGDSKHGSNTTNTNAAAAANTSTAANTTSTTATATATAAANTTAYTTTTAANTGNNSMANRNKQFNNNTKYGKQSYTQPSNQSQNHVEVNNTGYHNKSINRGAVGGAAAKTHGHTQSHSHQARVTGEQGLQHSSNVFSKTNNNATPQQQQHHQHQQQHHQHHNQHQYYNQHQQQHHQHHQHHNQTGNVVSATKASISNNPVDGTTTWAKLARKNNNSAMVKPAGGYSNDNENNSNSCGGNDSSSNNSVGRLEISQAAENREATHKESLQSKNEAKEKLSQDHSANNEQECVQTSRTVSKGYGQQRPSGIVYEANQSFTPPMSSVCSSGSTTGSGITAIDLGIKVGGISPPHGVQIGGGAENKSQGIGVFLPDGRTVDPNANDGLLFGSFGAVDISRISEYQIQIHNSILSEDNTGIIIHNHSSGSPANSSNTMSGHPHNFSPSNIGAMSGMTAGSSEAHNVVAGSPIVSGGNILNGWNAGSSSPSKESSSNNMIAEQGILHQNAPQRNNGAVISGSNVHNTMKPSGIANSYMGHSVSGGAVANYNNIPMAGGQGAMVGTGGVYSSNPAILTGNNAMNYNEAPVGSGASSNNTNSGNSSGGNGSNMSLAAAAAAAAAANPYNYAYLNYAGYTANFPYMVGNTAAFGFPQYNAKPSGHHHHHNPTPVFNQYSQGPNPGPGQHGLNGVYGMGGAGGSGGVAMNNSASGNPMVSDNISVNYHASNSQTPIAVGANSAHNNHINNQNSNSYPNIQSMLPPGMSHQQINMVGQQPSGGGAGGAAGSGGSGGGSGGGGGGGGSLQNQMNLPLGFNNGGASSEFGVEQAIPQAVFLGQPCTNSNKLEGIGAAHPGDFIHHQGYSNHHVHIQNPASNANISPQGNPNSGKPSGHAKGNAQGAAPGSFQGNMQYIGKPSGSAASSNTSSGTPNAANNNSASGNPSGAVSGAAVGTGIDLSHQSQGVGGNSGSGNSNMFLSGRPQNASGRPVQVQVGSGQPKQASVNFPGFHSSRTGNNTGFLQHNNNMWNNS